MLGQKILVHSSHIKIVQNRIANLFDRIFMLTACNIPFCILDLEQFVPSGINNFKWKLPSRTTFGNCVPSVCENIETVLKLNDKIKTEHV